MMNKLTYEFNDIYISSRLFISIANKINIGSDLNTTWLYKE